MRTQHFFMPIAVAGAVAVLSSCASGEQTSEPLMEPAGDVGTTAPSEPDETTGSSPPTTSAPATISEPTGEPTPTIPEVEAANEDEQAVIDTVKYFYEVLEVELLSNPESDTSPLNEWATGTALSRAEDAVERQRIDGTHLIGEIRFSLYEVITTADSASASGCYNPLNADIIDDSGDSVLPSVRSATVMKVDLVRDYSAAHGWIITDVRTGGPRCDAG